MSNLIPGITFSLSSLSDFSRLSLARNIVRTICDSPTGIRPERFGPFEGISPIGDVEEPAKFLSQSGESVAAGSLVLAVGNNCEYQIQWNKSEPPSFSFIGGYLLRKAFDRKPHVLMAFLAQVRKLASTANIAYGDIRSMEYPGWDTPFNLRLRLPDIPNASIYGKPYIEFFGRERIEGAPFQRIERLSDDLYWLQATELVTDPVSEDVRASIRKHFGEEAFMSGKKWRYSDGLHPEFDFSELA